MENLSICHSETIVVKVNYLGELKNKHSNIYAREKIVSVNDEIVYKEWEKCPHFLQTGNTSVALHEFEKQLSFRQQIKSAKQSRSNRRNFIQCVKIVWAKLLFKVFNFKT